MQEEFVKFIGCPDCQSVLEIVKVHNKTEKEITDAIVRCDCSDYPILNGILIYKKESFFGGMSSTAYILERLRMGRVDDAKALPLKDGRMEKSILNLHTFISSTVEFRKLLYPLLAMIRRRKKGMYSRISSDLSFFDIIDIIEPNTFGDYLKHRFSSQTFWSLYPFIPLIERKSERVLDLGCGAGQSSFVLQKHIGQDKLICADDSYTSLFLAKRFMAPEANFICLDANSPLPFPDDFFSTIVMMDSAHYVSNRALLGRECERILKQHGLLLFLHLHNALQDNVSKGLPLSPKAWKGLFQDIPGYLIPENSLIEDFLLRFELDLTKKYPEKDIDGSNAISLVGTDDNKLLDNYDNLALYIEKKVQNPTVNPIYTLKPIENEVVLQRRPPNDLFVEEYPLSMRFLPEKYTFPAELLRLMEERNFEKLDENPANKKLFNDMMRKFIIIDTPKGYQ